jgi:hypothetical protein
VVCVRVVQRRKTVASVNGSYREGVIASGEVYTEDSAGIHVIPYEQVLAEAMEAGGPPPWCDCGAKREPGWTYDRSSGFWVDSRCRRPSKLVWLKHANSRA